MVGTLLESSYFENIKVPALAHRLAYPYSARRPTRSQCPLGVGRQDHCQRVSQSVAPSPLSEALPRQGCSPDAMVCYCFLYRRSDLEREIVTVGEAQISARIATEIKTGNCACEVRNPTGRCCLGDVHKVSQELVSTLTVENS